MPRKTLFVFILIFLLSTISSPVLATDQSVFGPTDLTIGWWRIHLSFHHFSVNDPGDGLIIITKNTLEKRIRGGFLIFNRRFIPLRSFLLGTDVSLEEEVSLRSHNRLLVFFRGQPGASIGIEVGKKIAIPPPKVTFSADPATVPLGESTTLVWTTANADTVSIDQGIGDVPVSGSRNVSPIQTTTYTLTANGAGGPVTALVHIAVVRPPEDIDYGLFEDEQQGGGGLVGMKVRMLNGNNVLEQSDLSFPSPNRLSLAFVASYNSRSHNLGSLGYGWTHSYELSLDPAFVMSSRAFLKIVDHTGRAAYFEQQGAGAYRGIFKEHTYVRAEGGGYVWYWLDGSRYGFSDAGNLSWIDDPVGNRLELAYDEQDHLETVTARASGRILSFSYNANGLIEHISGPPTEAVPDGIWVTYGYDSNQNLTSVTFADGSGFTYAYTDPHDVHNLTEKHDKANHLLATWSYDEQDRCIDTFCFRGKGASITYGSETHVEVTDAYGTLRAYTIGEIDGRKRVAQLRGPPCPPYSDNNIVRWVYDSEMRLIETESAGGTITQYRNFDERGNSQTVKLAVGTPQERVITYTYHPDMNVELTRTEASVLGSGNKITIWDYDDDGNATPNESPTRLVFRIIEQGYTQDASGTITPYEYVTTFTFNNKGQVLTIDGPRPGSDDITAFAYDTTTGDLLSITRPLIGSTTLARYDGAGRPGRVTDVNAQSKDFAYDGRGRVTVITNNADSSSTTITYNRAGMVESLTDEDDVSRTFTYDSTYGRLERVTDVEGNYIEYQYDPQGKRIEMSKHDPLDNRTYLKRWSYEHPDIPGKLWKEINADDTFTAYGYDTEGNIASVTDPNGNGTSYEYEPLNRLTTVGQPGYVITTYTCDGHGNLASVTDAEAHVTTYEHDDMGRLVSTTSPDTGTVAYVYDEAGNLVGKTDAKGITVHYSYDLLNRLTGIHFPDSTEDITYAYDEGSYGKGHRTGITDPSGTITIGYDARRRLTTRETSIMDQVYSFGQTYTPGGRVSRVTYPSARTMDYTRDTMGRMEGLSTTYNSRTTPLVSTMTYNPFGSPKGLSTGSGDEVNNQSGECGCIEIANPGEQMERIYTYDGNRNLIDVHSPNVPWYNQTFAYDPLNRLTSAEGRYGTISYTYDTVGNRLTRTVNGDTEDYTYIAGTNMLEQITGATPTSFTYDAQGNTTAIRSKSLIYNQNNRLMRVEENGSTIAEYTYNGLGQRVTKTVGDVTSVYHYDLTGKLIAESQPDGTITAEYLYMGKIRIAKVDVSTGTIYYYLNDRLGTPQLMTDDTGTIVWEASYKPFGEAEVNPKSTIVNKFRFPGQYYDEETGLHYNYFRYYDPRSGRYLTRDTIGQAGGINLFVYAQNNPVNSTDRFGLLGLFGGASFRVTGPGVSGVASIRVIVGAEVDEIKGMLLAGGSGTFSAGGFAAGRGPEVGFFLGEVSDFLETTAIDIDTPIGGLTIFTDKQGKFAGLGFGGPSKIFGISGTGPDLPCFSYYPLDMELFSIDLDTKANLDICEN